MNLDQFFPTKSEIVRYLAPYFNNLDHHFSQPGVYSIEITNSLFLPNTRTLSTINRGPISMEILGPVSDAFISNLLSSLEADGKIEEANLLNTRNQRPKTIFWNCIGTIGIDEGTFSVTGCFEG
jgi:hypothetical protein